MLTCGLGLLLAGVQVFFRDVAQLLGMALTAWFYLTPIVYPIEIVPEWLRRIVSAQPMGGFVVAFHNILYDLRWPSAGRWVHLVVCAGVALALGQWVFARMSPRFAEEL
jgi:ABC-type polysaccharide/polyol phosphate export permease